MLQSFVSRKIKELAVKKLTKVRNPIFNQQIEKYFTSDGSLISLQTYDE